MKIVCISDTHQHHRSIRVPDGDVLVHAGDITNQGSLKALADFNAWLGELPHKHKVVIAGNHDYCFENHRALAEALVTNAIYLQDSGVEIEGIKFWGSPWSNEFGDWAFMGNELRLQHYWSLIPEDTQVLITHGPRYGRLDEVIRQPGLHVGSKTLQQRTATMLKLRLHVFGHIHEGYGRQDFGTVTSWEAVPLTLVNASTCDETYRALNEPIVVDI